MANKQLFRSQRGRMLPKTDTVNEAGGTAYQMDAEHALAQLAVTGTLADAYYSKADAQLEEVLEVAERCRVEYIAQTAIYARQKGHMKDMPALLLAHLTVRDTKDNNTRRAFFSAWKRVVDNGRMLRNFVQIMRSGVVGRKSLGSFPKRAISEWLLERPAEKLWYDSVGNDPSIADIIKMVHPKASCPRTYIDRAAVVGKNALFGYLLGKEHDAFSLPEVIRDFEHWRKLGEEHRSAINTLPKARMEMLIGMDLNWQEWEELCRRASWQQTRMNLNTFARHGVFDSPEMVDFVADKLRDGDAIRKARAFPYQLLMAYKATERSDMPRAIVDALHDALEIATENVPALPGNVVVCPDVSGSMSQTVTGRRGTATSAVECIDVAALMASCVLRKCPDALVLPFEVDVVNISLEPRDTVMTNARRLGAIGGGGTCVSAPLAQLNRLKKHVDSLIIVSDNESWIETARAAKGGYIFSRLPRHTNTMKEWEILKQRCPNAKMVCVDIQAYTSTQATDRDDILNIGGFSDSIWTVIDRFLRDEGPDLWVKEIKAIEL